MEFGYGALFERKELNYNDRKLEYFKFLDIVVGVEYTNSMNRNCFHVITGDYTHTMPHIIDSNYKEGIHVVQPLNFERAVEENNNHVDFQEIRNLLKKMFEKGYYKRVEDGIRTLTDKYIIDAIKEQNKSSDFNEQLFEKKTDISTMYNSIRETIVSQDEQIMKILTSLFKNQTVINSNLDNDIISKLKENIIIYGSTGTGKTEILNRIAKIYNVPIVIEAATSLSETGYQGRKVSDMLKNLCVAANNNIELAEKGILVIDEFDKLAEKDQTQSHVSREGVQRELLKILDGTTIYFDDKKFDTSKLTVVGLGAFTGIIKDNNYKNVTTDDFIKYGIMREIIARFSKTIPMNPLSKSDLEKILVTSNFSPLKTYQKLFELLKIDFNYTNDFVSWIAEEAAKNNNGARSLKTVFDNYISSAMFRIYAGEYKSIKLVKPQLENDKAYILEKKINRK
ncbi:MAG: AAA family ATPase [Firmicutes bacterium]|nr:AAA family ATPase [Bacillota bacterium]